jgi:gliding motility-associated-like protein
MNYTPPVIQAPQDTLVPVGYAFQPQVQGNGKIYWQPSTYLSCTPCSDPVITPLTDIDYILQVITENGCIAFDTFKVRVFEPQCTEPYLFVPNTFTPNGDNHNDVLHVYGQAIKELDWMIFNRWGIQVFHTTDPEEGWDGTYRGQSLNPDVFGYYVKILCIDGNVFEKKGNVSLLK